jgi:RNA-dependent RNA polymerase
MYARRGQCFTTTKYITKLEDHQLLSIDDIKRRKEDDPNDPDGEYTFTDGAGNISEKLAKRICDEFNLMSCSAFQIRLGGAKGVLLIKSSLGDKEELVQLRPSQKKFTS